MLRSIVLLAAVTAQAAQPAAQAPNSLTASDWSGIRAAYQRHRHAALPVPGGHRARNENQRWITRFDGRGFEVTPDSASWRWGLELQSYGFPGQQRIVHHARPTAKVEQFSYQWDSNLREWFVNEAAGLEHGFTLAARPGRSAAPLSLHLALRGTLTPRVDSTGLNVTFLDPAGAPALQYAGLKVTDSTGRVLPARFTPEPRGLRLDVDESTAVYPLTIDPVAAAVQQAYLKPGAVGLRQNNDAFGYSVSVNGDTVVIGAPQEDSSTLGINTTPDDVAGKAGAVYVFTRTAGVWTQQAYIKPNSVGASQADDRFGFSVALSGDTLVVGAPQEDSATTGINTTPDELALDAGAAYVFTRTLGVWSQQAYLKPAAVGTSQAGDRFGYSVSISGDTLVAGAFSENSSTLGVNSTPDELAAGAGAAYVFTRTGGAWTQQAYLKPAAIGILQANDHFGAAVSVSIDTIVVGAYQEDSSTTGINSAPNDLASNAGAAYVFTRSSGNWSQQAYLKPAAVGSSQAGDLFGWSVAASGDTVVVGAYFESSASTGINSAPNEGAVGAGAAYVFTRTAGVWSQHAYLKPAAVGASQAGDNFGWSVAIDANTIVVGAAGESSASTGVDSAPDEAAKAAGAAYVFARSAGVWSQQAYLKPAAVGATQLKDNFGAAVSINAGTVLVGAFNEASSSLGVNSLPDELAPDSGAAYVFTLPGPITITLSQSKLSFSAVSSPVVAISPAQNVLFTCKNGVNAAWTATVNKPWLSVSPGSGAGCLQLSVSIVPSALTPPGTSTGAITITVPGAVNSPMTLNVTLNVITGAALPFGKFETPADNATGISGSIAVTGWALDDIGVNKVTIWRDPIGNEPRYPNGLVYIGDALFVPGARPDVQSAFSTLPNAYRAGWGYMMLTNALPANGNGVFRIHAIAVDEEGSQVELGVKTITVDNLHAVRPFGALDLPAPGQTVFGLFTTSGWALTPQPASIAIGGATVWVNVDGVNIGNPGYGTFRNDVASIFPGYANSSTSAGAFTFDTAQYANGMHSIAWIVVDNLGRADGIGSRFFTTQNAVTAAIAAPDTPIEQEWLARQRQSLRQRAAVATLPGAYPAFRQGHVPDSALTPIRQAGDNLLEPIALSELDHLELHLPPGQEWTAALRVGGELLDLPVGSTFDADSGIFYWQLAPGFLGAYTLEFHATDGAVLPIPVQVGGPVGQVVQ